MIQPLLKAVGLFRFTRCLQAVPQFLIHHLLLMLVLIWSVSPSYAADDLSVHSALQLVSTPERAGQTALQADPAAQLVRTLLRGAKSDTEKAYRIYRWITEHLQHDERAAARIGDPSKRGLTELLSYGRGSCAVFADVTSRMMQLAGLTVRTVEGVARVGGVRRPQANHRWNEVWLNGEWRVVDSTWGAGYVDSGRFVRDNTDLFFAMPAEFARLSHFPMRRWNNSPAELESAEAATVPGDVAFSTFTRLSEQAVYLAAAGFHAEDLLRVAERGASAPDWYEPTNSPVKVLQAPPSKWIPSSRLARFVFQSNAYEEMAVVQGRTWQRQTQQAGVFDLALNPVPGELMVMGRRKGQDEFEVVLGYRVGNR